jgi:hypothetical protein
MLKEAVITDTRALAPPVALSEGDWASGLKAKYPHDRSPNRYRQARD